MKSVYAPIFEQKSESQNLGYLVVLLIVNFYLVYSAYLLVASRRFARRITQPIEKISKFISHINQQEVEETPISYVKIRELYTLIYLNIEIQEAKKKYLKINAEMGRKNKQLEYLAVTDPLTQAYNRLKLDEVLRYEIARAKRDKNTLSVILLDIDHFKRVNDTYGHQTGDAVLISIAQVLQKNIRRTDMLGRWGGEEFLLILPNTNLRNAAIQAEKLRSLIEFTEFAVVGKVTASLGVSSCIDNCTERSLIELADKALYRAKEAGRNCVETQETAIPIKLQLVKFLDERNAQNK
jgi:diguanylate cyclase (GGDEF)-like protein